MNAAWAWLLSPGENNSRHIYKFHVVRLEINYFTSCSPLVINLGGLHRQYLSLPFYISLLHRGTWLPHHLVTIQHTQHSFCLHTSSYFNNVNMLSEKHYNGTNDGLLMPNKTSTEQCTVPWPEGWLGVAHALLEFDCLVRESFARFKGTVFFGL